MKLYPVYDDLIEITSRFAGEVFIDYYSDLIGKDQASYMADLFLSEDAIRKLIDSGAVFKIVIDEGIIKGFIEYIREDERVFLSKLYVHRKYRRKGIGKFMFEDCVKYTKDSGLNRIYLTVNKHNTPSFNVYEHLGFKVIDSVVNDIGNGYVMDDYIMEITI